MNARIASRLLVQGLIAFWCVAGFVQTSAAEDASEDLWLHWVATENNVLIKLGFGSPTQWNLERARRLESGICWMRDAEGEECELPLVFDHAVSSHTATAHLPEAAVFSAACSSDVVQLDNIAALHRFVTQHYYGTPDKWPALYGQKRLSLELLPLLVGTDLRVTVLQNGVPAKAALVTVRTAQETCEFQTGEEGDFTLVSASPGQYWVSTILTRDETGQHEGKHFSAIQEHATLSLQLPGKDLAPLVMATVRPVNQLVRATLPRVIAFEAALSFSAGSETAKGQVRYQGETVRIELDSTSASLMARKVALEQIFAGVLAATDIVPDVQPTSLSADHPLSRSVNVTVVEALTGPSGAALPRTLCITPQPSTGSHGSYFVQCVWSESHSGAVPSAIRGVIVENGKPQPFLLSLRNATVNPKPTRLAN